jgi:hypothetical protein
VNASLTFRDAMRLAIHEQLAAYRAACAVTGQGGRRSWECEHCARRVQQSRGVQVEHIEPSFGQVRGKTEAELVG